MNNPHPFEVNGAFCSNPSCVLHVTHQFPNVRGQGNWATLPNGLVFGRTLVNGRYYCDACATPISQQSVAN